MFINENVNDFLKGKSQDDIEKDFFEKYKIKYYDLNETIKRLENHGIKCKVTDPAGILQIKGYNIQQSTKNGGTAWGLGRVISKKHGEKMIKELYKYVDFWKDNVVYLMSEDSIASNVFVTHVEALKILDRLEHES